MTPSTGDHPYTRDRGTKGLERPTLAGQSESLWMTPHGMAGVDHTGKVGAGGEFAAAVERWAGSARPTPQVADISDGTTNKRGEPGLAKAAGLWATPTGTNHDQGSDAPGSREGSPSLVGQTAMWPTPVASDDGRKVTENSHQPGLQLMAYHFSRPDRPPPSGNGSSKHRLGSRPRLNPVFVAWLMGWPLHALPGFGCSETACVHYRRRMRSALCGLLSGAGVDGGPN